MLKRVRVRRTPNDDKPCACVGGRLLEWQSPGTCTVLSSLLSVSSRRLLEGAVREHRVDESYTYVGQVAECLPVLLSLGPLPVVVLALWPIARDGYLHGPHGYVLHALLLPLLALMMLTILLDLLTPQTTPQ